MIRESYLKNMQMLVIQEGDPTKALEEANNLLNIMLSDIADGIKQKSINSGGVNHIDLPTAMKIIADGGIPTKVEKIDLAMDCIDTGDTAQAKKLLEEIQEEYRRGE